MTPTLLALIAWLIFPILTAALAERWGFGWPAGLATGLFFGPLGPPILWLADRIR